MDKKIIVAIIAGSIMLVLLGGFILTFIFLYKRRHRVHLHEKEIMHSQFQQELLRTQLEIQEQTFKTISQEIHDNIGQMLTLAKLNLNTLDITQAEKATEKINDAKQLVGKAIQDLRDLSKTLNTETIATIGLLKAIEIELGMLQKTGALQTHFEVTGRPVKIDAQKELIVFRMVQEALNNIMKHANATTVLITANFEGADLQLRITDDGCGFAAHPTENSSGSGMRNMRSRSKLIGANLTINSAAEKGTQIGINLPISA